ncbi:MAG TPA: O-acetyl-ADP-ribose deacetylase [Nocardioidaceae bacterium]|nr:O-acetyl-ADP-ribose deacetylase [Nocardioidaceae bacterium]
MKLTVVEGDITQQDVDAIVNAANERMRGGGGVDGAIHRAGGPAILEDCERVVPDGSRLPTGQAVATTAGRLRATWVIHVVGPVYRKTDPDEIARRRELLVSCYANALEVADELGAKTIAFPLVSAGIYGWPRDDAIRVAVDTIRSTPTRVEEARLVAFGRPTYDAMLAAL